MKPETFNKYMKKLHKLFFIEEDADRLKEYWEELKDMSDSQFVLICDYFKTNFKPASYKRFPLIGEFLEARRIVKPIAQPKMEEITDEECASPEEIGLYMRIIEEVHGLIKLGLSKYKKPKYPAKWTEDNVWQKMDYHTWAQKGFPSGWSDLYDHFAKLSYEAYLIDLNGKPGAYLEFLKDYYKKLTEKKRKRLEEIRKEK